MSIIPHREHFKLNAFKAFWEIEVSKSPCARERFRKHRWNIFDTHSKNMKRIGEYIMAKTSKKTPEFKWQGYANINITENQVADVEKFVADEKNVFFSYNDMLVKGYQIKVYFDVKTESMKVTATCYNHESPNFGYAMSAWADDWYTAIAVLVFKHYEIAEEDWSTAKSKPISKFG